MSPFITIPPANRLRTTSTHISRLSPDHTHTFRAFYSTMLAAFSSLAVSSPGEFGATGNMNGKYEVASGAKQGVKYNDDYASKGYEYFDVWAPEIATHYGEVFWTDQHDQPLPPAIVERFKGKVIALQGYEQDQVCV